MIYVDGILYIALLEGEFLLPSRWLCMFTYALPTRTIKFKTLLVPLSLSFLTPNRPSVLPGCSR